MNYKTLEAFLASEKWREADQETKKLMLKVTKRESEGWLNVESIDIFPCDDLQILDRLWIDHSKKHFGFSIQKDIFQRLGGTRENEKEVWEKFSDAVGWRAKEKWLNYSNYTFDILAPEGHLPILPVYLSKKMTGGVVREFGEFRRYRRMRIFSRIEDCKIIAQMIFIRLYYSNSQANKSSTVNSNSLANSGTGKTESGSSKISVGLSGE